MNFRDLYKRYIPQRQHFDDHQHFKHLGRWLHEPNLWHLNRRSAASAVAIGLFLSFAPIPGQMFLAAIVAVWARVNLPLAVSAVFFTNPITMGPLMYLAYKIGATVLNLPIEVTHFELSVEWLSETFGQIWKPLLLGCFVCGVFCAALGHVFVRLLWRLHLIQRWRNRKHRFGRTSQTHDHLKKD